MWFAERLAEPRADRHGGAGPSAGRIAKMWLQQLPQYDAAQACQVSDADVVDKCLCFVGKGTAALHHCSVAESNLAASSMQAVFNTPRNPVAACWAAALPCSVQPSPVLFLWPFSVVWQLT